MKLSVSLILSASLVALVACSKREDRPAASAKPIPSAPTGQPPADSQQPPRDLVSQDNERRQTNKGNLVTSNPNISNAPLIKKPRLDDVVTTSLQVQSDKGGVVNTKFVIVLKTSNEQAIALNFLGDKKMASQGGYQKLVSLDKTQNRIGVETRCLATCEHVLVRVRRNNGEESAFVFKIADGKSGIGELTMLPGLEQDPSAPRLLNMARIVELGYPVAQALEGVQKTTASSKNQIEKLAVENEAQGADGVAVGELRRGLGLLQIVQTEVDAALTETYTLTGLSLKSAGVKLNISPEQLSSIDRKLLSASQNIALAAGIVANQIESGKIKKLVEDSANSQSGLGFELRGIQDLINSAREKLPLMTQLIGKLGSN